MLARKKLKIFTAHAYELEATFYDTEARQVLKFFEGAKNNDALNQHLSFRSMKNINDFVLFSVFGIFVNLSPPRSLNFRIKNRF